jgi:tetratricopeptide (TPR) repeat protein
MSTEKSRHLNLIDAALSLQRAGEQVRAMDILLLVKEENPDYAPVHLLLGITYQDLDRLNDAEASLRRALEIDAKYAEALQALGLLLSAKGQLAEAIGLLKRHLSQEPEDSVSLKALSAALLQLGEPEEAVRFFQASWQETGAEEPGVEFGRLLIQLNRWAQAEAVLKEVAERHTSPRTLSEWALALTMLQRYSEACQALDRAVVLESSFDRAWRGLAHCYDRLGQLEEGLKAADRALAIDAQHYRNWQAKGDVLLSLERYAEAMEAAQQGIDLIDPDDEEARPVLFELLRQRFQALLRLGRIDEALEHLEEARRRFPTEERFPHTQVSYLTYLDRYEEALHVLNEAHQAGVPTRSNLVPLHYEVLHVLGKPDEAWTLVGPQLEEYKDRRLDSLGNIGLSLYLRGYVEPARAVFEQLYQFAPDEPRFSSNLGFILVGEGRLTEAKDCFQKALETPESESWQSIVLSNLGYLYLLEGEYEQAERALQDVKDRIVDTEDADREAILRVAYWHDGHILPDHTDHPIVFLPITLTLKANQVALKLASGQADDAERLARQIVEEAPDLSLGYIVLGSALLAQNLPDEARQAWELAMASSETPGEREMLTQWLE